jgi:hypothetical protein
MDRLCQLIEALPDGATKAKLRGIAAAARWAGDDDAYTAERMRPIVQRWREEMPLTQLETMLDGLLLQKSEESS